MTELTENQKLILSVLYTDEVWHMQDCAGKDFPDIQTLSDLGLLYISDHDYPILYLTYEGELIAKPL